MIAPDVGTISAAMLEEMLDMRVPCGGVKALSIPPCGSPATLVLDRRIPSHRCSVNSSAVFKCTSCYGKWLDATAAIMVTHGGTIGCLHCRREFGRLSDFASYVPF